MTATLAGLLILAACGGGGGSSAPPAPPPPQFPPPGPTAGPQSLVSAATPFAANCNGAPQTGTLYSNAEVEPFAAANPLNPSNLVGVWQQDRWSNGSSQGIVTGVSFDGGTTWSRLTVPFSRCAGGSAANGGDYQRTTDPWVTFSPGGVAGQIALSSTGDIFLPGSVSAVLVSRSLDGGTMWSSPMTLIRDGAQFFNDKDSITADPTDAHFVYAVWDRLVATGGGPSYFARTTDGGFTWEVARSIYDPGAASQTINNQIVVLPSGALINFFTELSGTAALLSVIRSTDHGVTWSAPVRIATVMALGTRDPDTGAPIRDGANLGSITAAPGGDLVAVWQDARFSTGARDGIAFARSADGGITWTAPVRVNADVSVQAFIPTVYVRTDGTIGVTYYDLRSNTSDAGTLLTEYWLARSNDGVTWRESRAAGPFDLANAPNANGIFLGDYQGLTDNGSVFVPFFAQTNNGNVADRTDIFAEVATLATGSAAAQGVTRQPVAELEASLTGRVAEGEPAFETTSALRRQLQESIVRTMQRRLPGREEMMQPAGGRPDEP